MQASRPDGEFEQVADLSPEQLALLMLRLREKAQSQATQPQPIDIQLAPRDGALPLSFAQQRLWFLAQLEPDAAAYHIPIAVYMADRLDVAALRRSLHALIRRHEVLRTTFATVDGQPVQVIAPAHDRAGAWAVPLRLIDLRALAVDAQEAATRRLAAEETARAFDLGRGPLLRATVLRRGPNDHVILLTLHHIISDGWSTPIFTRELSALYLAAAGGPPARLPELPIQYADYAVWQRAWLQGERLERQLAYWRRQLADLPVLDLPTERSRPAVATYRGAHRPILVSADLSAALAAFSQRHGATLFMTLLAAFQALLARYSGQSDIVVGTDIANRIRAKTEGLIGFFVNQLVLRTNLSGEPTIAELLGRARQTCLDAYAHQDLPFEQLVAEIQPDRHLNRTPLFQVKLILQNAPTQPAGQLESTLRPLQIEQTTALFDLLLALEETPHGIVGTVAYSTDLFEETTIARLLGHFQNLLAGIVSDAARRLGDLPLLSAAERAQLLVEWNSQGDREQGTGNREQRTGDRGQEPSESWCIHQLFEAQAARTPDAVAIVFEPNDEGRRTKDERGRGEACLAPTQHLTYAALNARANRLAHYLRELGVGPDVLVALCLERSVELVIGLLGILKAGGAYLPLDPSYPYERLAYMLDDSMAAVLLTRQGLVDDLPPFWGALVCTDADWPRVAQASAENPGGAAQGEHIAYVIYTSGSTGYPKGVQIRHVALARRVRTIVEAFGLAPGQRLLQFVSLSFDASAEEIFPTLVSGAGLVLHHNPAEAPAVELMRLAERLGVTMLHIPPAYWYGMTDSWPAEGPSFERLGLWVTGGERSAAEKLAALARLVGHPARFIHVYGPTEATITSTLYKTVLDARALGALPSLPIGRPLADTRVYVLDQRMRPVPIGIVGELYIGGAALARGYLGRPELTAERFVPNPFSQGSGGRSQEAGVRRQKTNDESSHLVTLSPCHLVTQAGSRLYRTGDLVRYLPDGNIVFLGRRDEQVKVRGQRIELGEIEAVLRQHPRVREAVALAREDTPGDVRLVAYVVQGSGVRSQGSDDPVSEILIPDPRSLISDLRGFAQTRLPAYMLPAVIVPLDALPLTPSGKIDRRALPAPEAIQAEDDSPFVAPRTPIEQLLAQVWAEVLERERVGIDENFFALGGHSLLVTQLISRIAETFQVELPFRDAFEAPTVEGLAARIAAARQAIATPAAPALLPAAYTNAAPLSYAQQRLWFLVQLEPDSPAYNIPIAVRLDGRLATAALARSLQAIIARHAALRTTFAARDGQPIQVIGTRINGIGMRADGAHTRAAPLLVIDLQALPEDTREAAARRLAAAEARRPFDLGHGPLLRAALLRLHPHVHVALLTMHHIVSDGWSAGIFMRELAAYYAADLNGQPAALPDLPIQYVDYAIWQRAWLRGEVLAAHLAYWQRKLADLPLLRLPTDRPRPPAMSHDGASREFTLPKALSDELADVSRREGVTVFMTLLAAFQVLLARYSGQDDIAVGTDVANRTRLETESLIGFFVNQLVLRSDLCGNPSARELLARVREVTLDAYAHQDLPFEELVRALNPERSLAHAPLFQVKIILQNTPAAPNALPGLALSPLVSRRQLVQFDLLLFVNESPDGLFGALQYRTDLFDATTIARMLRHLRGLLEAMAAEPDRGIAELPLFSAAERAQLLREWNDTAAGVRGQASGVSHAGADFACIHALFEAQVERTPDAIAIVFEDATNDERPTTNDEGVTGEACLAPTRHLTYRELNSRANRLAHHLRGLGVGPEVRVGVCMERSPELIIALLGVLKAGGAYLPLDPAYPAERLAFMLDDSMVAVLLTQERLAGAAPATWALTVALDAEWPALMREPAENPAERPAAENLAYVIYTSGSTGAPKGVQVPHRGLANLARSQIAAFDVYPRSRVLQFAALGFDAAVSELWMALLAGAALIVPAPGAGLAGPPLAELLHEQAITTVTLPPSILATLPDTALPGLRTLVVAGEACPSELTARWREGRRLLNAYGPTEATVCATIASVAIAGPPAIGRPLTHVQAYVLDGALQPAPIGIPGELHIGGIGLARGYLGRPDLTASAFVPNPFARMSGVGCRVSEDAAPNTRHPIPGTRLYKTGDQARYRADGQIEFLGRLDQQVKVRGFRIELGEIEAALARHPSVYTCAVAVREDEPGQHRLVAYIVQGSGVRGQESGGSASETLIPDPRSLIPQLRGFLKQTLPAYMIPATCVLLDALPLTPSGKVDRRALPAPDAERPAPDHTLAAPRTPVEEMLARIWGETLRITQVGVHDNFFALGGDSILSMQVVARAQQAGLRLTPKLMFQYQTIAELARVAGALVSAPRDQGLVEGPLPLTPIQRWLFEQDLPDPHHYNQALLLSVRQPLAGALLGRALRHLLAHHDALRLRFTLADGDWRQINAAVESHAVLQLIDLAALPLDERSAAITSVAAALQSSLDLARGPLLRAALFDGGAGQPGHLLIIIHHLAVDGVSWRILLEDLQTAYVQISRAEAPRLPAKTTSFQAWAEQLQGYATSEELRAELGYWLATPRRAIAPLPVDAAGANTLASARSVAVELSAEETHALLGEVPAAYRTRINDALLAALAQALAEWTGQRAALIDLEGHGREDLFEEMDLTRTVGWFTTQYPVLLELPRDGGAGAALKAVKEQLRAVPGHGIGYGLLRYLGRPDARERLRTQPSAGISFNYLGQVDQAVSEQSLFGLAPISTGAAQSPRGQRSHLLEVNGVVAAGRLRVEWTYSEQIHRRATVERLAEAYIAALRRLIAHCRAPDVFGYTPSDFPLARLDQRALDQLAGGERGIEDVYPLAPLQQGLLFHTLHSPETGEYVAQLACTFEGELHVAAFQRAWQRVIDRHAILRTAFAWAGVEQPVQVVYERGELPWQSGDWRALAPAGQEARLADYLVQQRAQGFALARPPLMRLALFRLADESYRFVWSHHHLLLDGWSVAIILNEVFEAYLAFAAGREAQAPPPPRYRDYIAWLHEQDLAAAEAFWRQYLRGVADATPLGVEGLVGLDGAAVDYATQQAQLSAERTIALQALARQHGLTLSTLLHGAWALLLSRYSGEREVVFGATVAGRPPDLAGYESMVGLFINTLPVRVAAPPDAALIAWLHALQDQQAELRQYEHTPLVAIQGWSAVPRGTPLFESIVVFENYPISASVEAQAARPGPAIGEIRVVERTNYPIALEALPGPPLGLRISYQGRRFGAATIARMLRHLRTLLEGFTSEATLAALPLLTRAERQQVLLEWNNAAPGIGDHGSGVRSTSADAACLHELFTAQAARTPDAIAIVFDTPNDSREGRRTKDESAPSSFVVRRSSIVHLTYAALDRRANQLARHLRTLGVEPEMCVALRLERSPEVIVGLLGILKAGGVFLPLDPTYPAERIAFMLEDSAARILLTNDARCPEGAQTNDQISHLVTLSPCHLVNLKADWPIIAQQPDDPPVAGVTPGNLAYVIYTSGSTGRPKGVPIRHGSAVPFFAWYQRYFELRPDDRIIQYHSLSFDFSTWEIFEALLAGASLHIVPEAVARDVGALAGQLVGARTSVLNMTPSQFSALADYVKHDQPWALRRLRLLVLGGELLPGALAQRAAELTGPACLVYNEYGPTETTISSAILRITADTLGRFLDRPGMPIGRPIGDTQLYALDPDLRPAPVGVPGELYIGGFGLARGYHARPDLTATRFIPNPFAEVSGIGYRVLGAEPSDTRYPIPNTRLYKTGDLARYLPDGRLEILGRRDQQIKLRGYRIELEEIAAVLAQHPSVRNVAVLAHEDAPGERRLVAYIVQGSGVGVQGSGDSRLPIDDEGRTTNDENVDSSFVLRPSSFVTELKSFLAQRLPDYMIPASFVMLDALPLTASGKIDRKALPAPNVARPAHEDAFAAPRTPAEDLLATIWAGVLRIPRVGIHDNFFALGGHSLLATQVIARVRASFGAELPLRALFEAPTVAGLAGRLAQREAGALPALLPARRDGAPPLSFAQQRLWFIDQLQPHSSAYNIPAAFRLAGPLDIVALARSLAQVVRRHEVLRTTFALHDGQPVQVIAPVRPLRSQSGIREGTPSNAKNDSFFAPLRASSRLGMTNGGHAANILSLIDLQALESDQRQAVALRLAQAEARRSFDLARGPLLRTTILRLDADTHALLVTLHHISADARSMQVLFGELSACYAMRVSNHPAPLPDLPVQYADYAIWQRAWPPELVETQLAYWKEQLADLPTLELPADRARPAVETFAGAQRNFTLPAALWDGLRALSRANEATLFMALLAGWQALLARYSGADDVAVGTPIAGRTHQALEGLIGLFLNTLVLRADLSGEPSFEQLLARVRAACLGAYAHQDLPFEQLVDALQPTRDLSRHPLFQVLCTLEHAPPADMRLPSLDIQPLAVARTTTTFDLILSLQESAGGLSGTLGYRTDLFDAATIARMIGHLQNLLQGVVEHPRQRLADLALLSPAQRHQLLVGWNDTATGARSQESGVSRGEAYLAPARLLPSDFWYIHELFAAQAERAPHAVALIADQRPTTNDESEPSSFVLRHSSIIQLTYRELNRRANQLAHHLRRLGVGPELCVGICMERSPELVIALLGVLKAGGAYLPLDPSYPGERLNFMLADSGARVLITANDERRTTKDERPTTNERTTADCWLPTDKTGQPVTLSPCHLVHLNADWPIIAREPAEEPPKRANAQNLAYVIYTSGSTGRPKGVQIPHRALTNLLGAMRRRPGLTAQDRLLAVTTLSFDIAALELFLPLVSGACVELARRADAVDGARLAALLARGATLMQATPATWRLLLEAGWAGSRRLRALCGGEALPPDLAGRLLATVAAVWNMYGPTETTIWSAIQPLVGQTARVAIGCPIANTQLYVLDRAMQPAPLGIPGELYIGGAGLARGYLGRPDLTAAHFIPNPFAEVSGIGYRVLGAEPSDTRYPIPNTRLYKTGDLARYLPDGNVEFLGRIDGQVKLRGYRIELGEVEAALAQHPSVRAAAALVREDALGDARLVAYIVQESGVRSQESGDPASETLTPDSRSLIPDLRSYLAERLPSYMLPSIFVALDALPLTANGKLDRKALRAVAPAPRAPRHGFVAPRDPGEALLAQLWAAVLRLEQVGIHDNFFELGGHSLLGTQLISRVRDTFGVELPIRSLFEAPTVAGLAERITHADAHAGPAAPPLRPASRVAPLPLSFAQQRLWFLDQLEPDSPAYSMPTALRLSGPLDLAALVASLRAVVGRHETLRTTFPADDGQPVQQIAPAEPQRRPRIREVRSGDPKNDQHGLILRLLDLRALPGDMPAEQARRLAGVEARRPFDLAAGPLFRAALLRLGPQEHVVLLTMHHIIADAWSVGVLIAEISALYTAHVSGQPPDLPDLAIQYADYAVWQRAWLQGDVLAAQLAYWKGALADLPMLQLPTDRPRPAIAAYRGGRRGFVLPAALRAELAALSREAGATLFMTLLAGFQVLLARYSGQEDLAVGTPIAGRTRAETEPLIGYFVNTLVLRANLAGAATFDDVLARVRAVCLGAYAHQEVPFEQVVDALAPARDLSRHPLFQVMFALQNAPMGALALPDLRLESLSVEHETAQFDLSLSVEETADALTGTLEYLTDLFDAATIARLLGHFRTLLEGIVARSDRPLVDLPLLTAAERLQLLEWNDTTVEVRSQESEARGSPSDSWLLTPDSWCLHHLFEEQAGYTPDAVAVVFQMTNDERRTTNDEPESSSFVLRRSSMIHLTYRELDGRANQLARHLRALGVGPEACVGIDLPRSAELPIALLGVLKAGAAYLPLDPAYPAERRAFMLADSRAAVLITTKDVRCPEDAQTNDQLDLLVTLSPCHLVNLEADWPAIVRRPAGPLGDSISAAHPAYAIYTSGSTGQPKGVLVPHQALVNYTSEMVRRFAMRPADRVLQFAALGFDVLAEELFPAWASGAAVVLHDRDLASSLADFVDLLEQTRVTVVELSAPYWHAWVDDLDRAGAVPSALRLVLVGCEKLDPDRLARWRRFGVPLTYVFGLTETAITSALYHLPTGQGYGAQRDGPPIGLPIANTQLYVLDAHLRSLPIGVPGELYIGGAGLARGYLNRPDLTADRFIPNPFVNYKLQIADCRLEDSSICNLQSAICNRLYRTGDLARYRPDGTLDFLGRSDQQVKLRGFRVELGEIEAALRSHPSVYAAAALLREDAPGHQRLVAYIVQKSGVRSQESEDSASETLIPDPRSLTPELRGFLKERLPSYMLPSTFVALDALPLTPNGKIDRKALPAPERAGPATESAPAAPRTPTERRLAEIWRAVLNVERVGIHDNFFALGGDSIISIQIIARARQAGLRLTAKQLFQHQTIAELAAVAGVAVAAQSEQGLVEGAAPLTPIQHWFFAQELPDPHYFNQALLLSLRQPLDLALLDQAMRKLHAHHDTLRLRFVRAEEGWRQRNAGAEPHRVVACVDVAALPEAMRSPAITAAATQAQTSLDLARGPIMRVVLFRYGDGQPNRLLVIVHHLAVDGISWRILVEDLQNAYGQLSRGEAPQLPPKTTAFAHWAARLHDYARSEELRGELGYWLSERRARIRPLPRDHEGGANTIASAEKVIVTLGTEETRALLSEVPAAYHTQINDVLLAALALAFAPWTRQRALLLDLEGHGREPLFEDVDLSRTVGWYTTLFPLLLDLEGAEGPGAALKAVKEQLRAVPQRGIGYGLLRYLGPPEARARLAALPAAEVLFNYLGQVDQAVAPGGLLGGMAESSGLDQSPHGRRSHALEVNSIVVGGRLELTWTYSPAIHAPATVERLAQGYLAALRALIVHCLAPDSFGYTPSDFPLARIDQPALDRLAASRRRIEDLYPLTPLQQGILFHTLYAPGAAMYFSQLHCTFHGELDRVAFGRAWQQTVERHPILRTTFVWEGLPEPLQVVQPAATLPLDQLDWRDLAEAEQRGQLERLLAADQARGFDLAHAPLMRLTLIRTAGDTYHFIWSHHHLLTDGWSTTRLVDEVFLGYTALTQGREAQIERPRPYRDYIAWLQQQDLAQTEAFWRHALRGLSAPTPLMVDHPARPRDAARFIDYHHPLGPQDSAALQALARRHGLTLNTLIQGAWALLLSRYSGQNDVLFGATVAGRPPDLAGVETMVGLFINTLPVRAAVPPDAALLPWLAQLQAQQIELRQYEHSPLVAVQGWSDVPRELPLFESIVVFENYPANQAIRAADGVQNLSVGETHTLERNNYPLTLTATPGDVLDLFIAYDSQRFEAIDIARMLGHLARLLDGMAAAPVARLADLPLLTAAERSQLLIEWNDTAGVRGQGSGVRSHVGARHASPLQLTPDSWFVHDLFAAQAERTPDAVALVFDNPTTDEGRMTNDESKPSSFVVRRSSFVAHLTYAELNARAEQLARHLRGLGVGPDVRVGVCMERSIELVVALLGVLKAGGAYLPLDPTYPPERLAFMLDDSQVPLLLTQARLADQLPNYWALVLCLDADWPLIAQAPAAPAPRRAMPDDLAYVIYTSGSTGQPKGVMISHGGLANYLRWCGAAYDVALGGALLHSPISFDLTITSLFAPLLAGQPVVLVAEDAGIRMLDEALRAGIGLGLLKLTPAHLELLRHQPLDPAALARIRTLVIGGEALWAEQLAFWPTHVPGTRIVNEYGPTETVVGCCVYVAPARGVPGAAVPIGRPIANTRLYVLDARLRPMPIGVPGELYIGGAQLAHGYLNRPELTAERFVPNPFAEVSGIGYRVLGAEPSDTRYPIPDTRLYKTGDLARYLPDGNLVFLGRRDDQVKLRGYRIELGEIAAALRAHPAIVDAAVVLREDAPGDARLVAYVVPTREQGTGDREQEEAERGTASLSPVTCHLSPSELPEFLAARLPDYMIPSAFVALDALPLTPNGKLDRAALPPPDGARLAPESSFVAPRTPVEAELARIWAEVLGVERVGIYDNFFALGGHSLLATRVVTEVQAAFKLDLPLPSLFEHPTVAGLAELLIQSEVAQADEALIEQMLADLEGLSIEELDTLLDTAEEGNRNE